MSEFLLVSGFWHLFVSNSLLELLSGFRLKHKVVNSAEFLFFTMSIFKPSIQRCRKNISEKPLKEQSSRPKGFQTFAEDFLKKWHCIPWVWQARYHCLMNNWWWWNSGATTAMLRDFESHAESVETDARYIVWKLVSILIIIISKIKFKIIFLPFSHWCSKHLLKDPKNINLNVFDDVWLVVFDTLVF